jgi:hypothetical protein
MKASVDRFIRLGSIRLEAYSDNFNSCLEAYTNESITAKRIVPNRTHWLEANRSVVPSIKRFAGDQRA